MGDTYREIYSSQYSAAAINTTASETFGGDATHGEKMSKYGSNNSLIITSVAAEDFNVLLDGVKSIGICFARGGIIVKPADGIFFNTVKLTNISGTNSSADEVKVRLARAEPIN